MQRVYTANLTGLAQADGAQEFAIRFIGHRHIQIQVFVSATPDAGTLTVAIKSPDVPTYQDVEGGSIDLTGTLKPLELSARAEAIRFTPSGFDADKTYDIYITTGVD